MLLFVGLLECVQELMSTDLLRGKEQCHVTSAPASFRCGGLPC